MTTKGSRYTVAILQTVVQPAGEAREAGACQDLISGPTDNLLLCFDGRNPVCLPSKRTPATRKLASFGLAQLLGAYPLADYG
jgi:hypothetical protein